MRATPDSWIERHWLDEPVQCEKCERDVEHCVCEPCVTCGFRHCECLARCDNCGQGMPTAADSGYCQLCEWEEAAQRQLTFPGYGTEMAQLVGDIGPQTAGLVWALGRLEKHFK